MTRKELEAKAKEYSESEFVSGRLDIEHGIVGIDFYKIYEAAFKEGFLTGRDAAAEVLEAWAFNESHPSMHKEIKTLGETRNEIPQTETRLEQAEAIIKLAVGSITPYEGTNGLATLEAAVKYYNRYLKNET